MCFQLGKPGSKRPAPKVKVKSAPKAKQQRKEDPSPGTGSKPEKQATLSQSKIEKSEKGNTLRIETTLHQNQKVRDLLLELSPDVLWRSLVRTAELDRRLSKAQASEHELQKVAASDKATAEQKSRAASLQDEIAGLLSCVSAMKQFFLCARSQSADDLAQQVSTGTDLMAHLTICAHRLLSDFNVLMDIVHSMAKKLVEAPLGACSLRLRVAWGL